MGERTTHRMPVHIKRIYEPPGPRDGTRVLVDRLWPRGVSKDAAAVDRWMKEVAPSTELRQWFGHDPARWDDFRRRYEAELVHQPQAIHWLREQGTHGRLTLLYAARDERHNHAVVLREVLLHEVLLRGNVSPGQV